MEMQNDAQSGSVDFSSTISRLDLKAKKSRNRVTIISMLLFSFVAAYAVIVFYELLDRNLIGTEVTIAGTYNRPELERNLVRRVSVLVDSLIGSRFHSKSIEKFQPPSLHDAVRLEKRIEKYLNEINNLAKIVDTGKRGTSNSSAIANAVTNGIFGLGAIAFVILMIQMALMFMKYHTRLAELYEAQADALRASNGDADRAYRFMEQFSPNVIEIGRSPVTLYEKALETVKEVAKRTK